MENFSQNKSGFTLVELAIVIVIIGLIVGGVVGAQSLIATAKINSVIKELNSYSTAVKAFQLEYNSLPGDFKDGYDYWSSEAECGNYEAGYGGYACRGNGDKKLNVYGGAEGSANSQESFIAWKHMQWAGILNLGLSGVHSTANRVPFGASPGSEIGGESIWNVVTQNGTPYFMLYRQETAGSYGGASPIQSKKIDKKIDNDNPLTGKVTARNGWNCIYNSEYNVGGFNGADSNSPICTLYFYP